MLGLLKVVVHQLVGLEQLICQHNVRLQALLNDGAPRSLELYTDLLWASALLALAYAVLLWQAFSLN